MTLSNNDNDLSQVLTLVNAQMSPGTLRDMEVKIDFTASGSVPSNQDDSIWDTILTNNDPQVSIDHVNSSTGQNVATAQSAHKQVPESRSSILDSSSASKQKPEYGEPEIQHLMPAPTPFTSRPQERTASSTTAIRPQETEQAHSQDVLLSTHTQARTYQRQNQSQPTKQRHPVHTDHVNQANKPTGLGLYIPHTTWSSDAQANTDLQRSSTQYDQQLSGSTNTIYDGGLEYNARVAVPGARYIQGTSGQHQANQRVEKPLLAPYNISAWSQQRKQTDTRLADLPRIIDHHHIGNPIGWYEALPLPPHKNACYRPDLGWYLPAQQQSGATTFHNKLGHVFLLQSNQYLPTKIPGMNTARPVYPQIAQCAQVSHGSGQKFFHQKPTARRNKETYGPQSFFSHSNTNTTSKKRNRDDNEEEADQRSVKKRGQHLPDAQTLRVDVDFPYNFDHPLTGYTKEEVPGMIVQQCSCNRYKVIPRPANSFIIFRKSWIRDHPQMAIEQMKASEITGRAWKSLSAKDRKPYEDEAKRSKTELLRTHPDWKYVPNASNMIKFGYPNCTCGAWEANTQQLETIPDGKLKPAKLDVAESSSDYEGDDYPGQQPLQSYNILNGSAWPLQASPGSTEAAAFYNGSLWASDTPQQLSFPPQMMQQSEQSNSAVSAYDMGAGSSLLNEHEFKSLQDGIDKMQQRNIRQ